MLYRQHIKKVFKVTSHVLPKTASGYIHDAEHIVLKSLHPMQENILPDSVNKC